MVYVDTTPDEPAKTRTMAEIRKDAALSLEVLAATSGVPVWTLMKIERGHTKDPRSKTLARIADALGVTMDELWAGVSA